MIVMGGDVQHKFLVFTLKFIYMSSMYLGEGRGSGKVVYVHVYVGFDKSFAMCCTQVLTPLL